MFKKIASSLFALLFATCVFTSTVPAAGGSGGGGGGGGSTKPVTVRLTGIITNIQPGIGGVYVTVGTSYYAVGVGIVTSDTQIKLNGSSSGVTVADLRLGDSAQMDVNWTSRYVTKLEVVGIR